MTYVIEGTWEEIKQHEAELVGRRLRVTVKPEKQARKSGIETVEPATLSNTEYVSARGSRAGILSVDDFLRQKQEEIDLEDRPRR